MTKLSTSQFLYLLYAYSYCFEKETVTKSNVKTALSSKVKESIDNIYDVLLKQDLITSPRRGRLSVTNKGINILIENVGNIDYKFSNKNSQHRMLNTLMQCWKLAASSIESTHIDFDIFLEIFTKIYFQEKKAQEVSGVVAIHKQDIYQKFVNNKSISISPNEWEEYFNVLKSTGKIFTSTGENDELVHWAE
ncbi:hypothetical protein NIES4103_37100 [Nostoc sp. NIES-4103]|nr:hypothetical protein NIES4103_37100 [Nostoc sp. NIES-4103]